MRSRKIRIVEAPIGEAPDWVRDAWVGLDLPIVGSADPRTRLAGGVLSGPKTFWTSLLAVVQARVSPIRGYMVPTDAALDVLAASSPAAADWWRANAPHVLTRHLLFGADACRLLDEP